MGNLCAKNHRITSVIDQTGLDFLNVDGIMGLGKKRYNDLSRTYIETLYEEKQIAHKMCAFLVSLQHDRPSKFMIGGYDLKYTKGPIHWHKADQEFSQWALNLTGIKFGDDVLMAKPHPKGAFPDTGTSLNTLPSTVYWALITMM
jgi:hypothetical protein